MKFADNTAVIARFNVGNKAAYRREVASLVTWCEDNNLTLNMDKTKEIILDMRKERRTHHQCWGKLLLKVMIAAEVFSPAPGDPLSWKVYFQQASVHLPAISKQS